MAAVGRGLRPDSPRGKAVTVMSEPSSRIVQPGVFACDGWRKCGFEGTRREVRIHQRDCAYSDVGALYRVLRGRYGL